jgi:hypothetical protein
MNIGNPREVVIAIPVEIPTERPLQTPAAPAPERTEPAPEKEREPVPA